jgi:hypothetical protein
VKARDDFRLGLPIATGPVLDHLCPICEGEADSRECYCHGRGLVTADQAAAFAADDPDPRWQPRPLPPVPRFTGRRCHDCAFRPDSQERDGVTSAAELFDHLALCNDGDRPFYCHQGMHHGARGYVPRQSDKHGAPIGHPICAGWLQQYRRNLP